MNPTGSDLFALDPTGKRIRSDIDHLRAVGPAVKIQLPGGFPAWSVTRGPVIKALLTSPHISKKPENWHAYRDGQIPEDWELINWMLFDNLLTNDGDDHTRLKKLIGPAFTPRRIKALRPVIENIVHNLVTGLQAKSDGQTVDLRAEFSSQLPTRLICGLFGVPTDQRPAMVRLIGAVLDTTRPAGDTPRELAAAMSLLLETKRQNPGKDLTTDLLTAYDPAHPPTEHQLVTTLITIIGAGIETTVALIDWAIVAMLTHPEQLSQALAAPARWKDVIEETLRRHPPIMHLPLHAATADIDLGDGVLIREGDALLMGFGAHGLDPDVHADPDTFDIDRTNKEHLAFGHGIHYCVGAPLAKLEAEIALPALFTAFPRLALAAAPEGLVQQPSFIGNDVRQLPALLAPQLSTAGAQ